MYRTDGDGRCRRRTRRWVRFHWMGRVGRLEPSSRLRLRTASPAVQDPDASDRVRLSTARSRPGRVLGRLLSIPLRLLLLGLCASQHDVFVFLSRTRFVSYRELLLLRLLGKKTVEILLGSDARPAYMDGNLMRQSWNRSVDDCRRMLAETAASLRVIERYATVIVSHPLYAQLQHRRSAHALGLGLPIRFELTSTPSDGAVRSTVFPRSRPPVVLHSPSSPEVKGTALVRRAITQLRNEGIELDYRELSNVPNDEVIAAISGADLIIDQCYSDTPLAMFATEAAIQGRPVIVAGYGWEEHDRLVPSEFMAPTIRCAPEDLTSTLRDALSSPETLDRCGAELARYVGRLDAPLVAQRLIELLNGTAPANCWFEPAEVRYQSGCGMSADRANELRQALFGPSEDSIGRSDHGDHNPEQGIL